MAKLNSPIWFWQRMRTPHMGAIAEAMAEQGHRVTFVANSVLSRERVKEGWQKARLNKAIFILATNKNAAIHLARNAPKNSIHLCQGFHSNGLVSNAQKILRDRGLRHWIIIEKIDESGLKGKFKKLLYRMLVFYWKKNLQGILAIGHGTKDWIIERGIEKKKVYPFAYFLNNSKSNNQKKNVIIKSKKRPYRFLFVGRLIQLKKVELLIRAIATLKFTDIELWIVGDGPERDNLYSLANLLIPNKVHWHGILPMSKIPKIMNQVDCLVLPSRHDGWGAVVSEALMSGTPVICSNACGSSIAVKASGVGGVFQSNNKKTLSKILYKQYKLGKISKNKRQEIIRWAKCLNATSGAKYLERILSNHSARKIYPPWEIDQ